MSGIVLKSARSGYSAVVNEEGQLLTKSLMESYIEFFAERGKAFWLSTDFITLTNTGVFNGVFYMKNTSALDVFIWGLRFSNESLSKWKMIKNPTTGTLISAGTAGHVRNLKFDSGVGFDADVLKGADGLTVTDGEHLSQLLVPVGYVLLPLDGGMILSPGKSLALTCKPSVAGDIGITVFCWQSEED